MWGGGGGPGWGGVAGLFLLSNDEDALSLGPCLSVSGKRWRKEY